ncbi:hypothetical protein KJ848_00955, partial [Patescibacteria group bacterium]|nr:hypothetical protein [Patescibacteria group bacterium]
MKTIKNIYRSFLILGGAVLVPALAQAQDSGGGTGSGGTSGGPTGSGGTSAGTGLKNPLNNIDTLPQFLNAILDAVVQLGTIVLILALVYVGFQ